MARSEYPDAPRVAVGGVVIRGEEVLLVLRGNPPAPGQWAIPGGSVHLGETLQAAVERELLEETGVTVRAGEPVYVLESIVPGDGGRPRYHYVIVDLLASYVSGEPTAGDDAREARWVHARDLDRLKVTRKTVELLTKLGFVPPPSPDRPRHT
jgi:8-oxo-dGTP diphosphatase